MSAAIIDWVFNPEMTPLKVIGAPPDVLVVLPANGLTVVVPLLVVEDVEDTVI
jgi:hypothetical protein